MLNITIRQLKVFEAVARHLSYTRAAKELHLTQPAVSMQIKQLEDAIGHKVLEPFGKKNYLTAAGKEMQHYGREILHLLDETEDVLLDLKGLKKGSLDISVATTANDFATRILAEFSRQHEKLNYRIDVTNRKTLIRQLEENEKDLVIMGKPPQGLDVELDVIMENPLVVIASSDHPLASEKQISLDELIKYTFVVREQGSGTRIAMERFFSKHGVEMTTSMEMTSNEAIKQAVQAGLGLGIVSIHTLNLELETGRIVLLDVQNFPILRHWYVVYKHGKRLSAIADAFRTFVLQEGPSFLKS
ncbi:MAG TPA: LysR family transcriptional regulator [Gammaproteobacteria bacterium]|nr:LysR family transcriptional regulator [Gammaproteobacteria bacterium]